MIDNTIKQILNEIKDEIKDEFDLDFSLQELYEICNSQFVIANLAFKKGLDIRLPVLGAFINKDFAIGIDKFKKFKEKYKHLSEKEYDKMLTRFKIYVKKKNKEETSKKFKKDKIITLKQLQSSVDLYNIPNKYDKYLTDEEH